MGLAQKVLLNASLMAVGRVINAALGVVGVGITTRYLGLHDYGTLVTALAFVAIFSSVTDLGLWTIGTREIAKHPAEQGRLIGVLISTGGLLAATATIVGYGVMFAIYRGDPELEAIALMLLQLPLSAPVAAVGAYFIAQQKAYVGMIASTTGSVLMLGLLVLAVQLDLGFTAVVLAFLSNGICFALVMIAFSIGRIPLRPKLDFGLSRRLLGWALPLGGFLFVNALYARVDILILSWLASRPDVALYGLAFKVVDTLVILPSYVTITLLPEFARLMENRERLEKIMQKAFTVMEVATVPVLVFFLALAPQISEVLGGPNFRDSAPILRILIVGVGLIFFATVLSQGMIAFNQQGRLFRLALVGLAINLVLNLALIPPLGGEGAALAFVASEIGSVTLLYVAYARLASGPRLYRPLSVLVAGGAMAGVAVLAELVAGSKPGLALLLGGAAGGPVYVACLYVFKAMPDEIHTAVVQPVLRKLKPKVKEAP